MRQGHSHYWFSLLLKQATTRSVIRQIHAQLLTTAFHHSSPIPSTAWNSLIRHYSLGPFPQEAIFLFKHLQFHPNGPISFDSFAYSFLIKACANLQNAKVGTEIHALTVKSGFESHVYVQTALVNMYVDCGCLCEATTVFDEMPERNSVTWNALITGLIKWGEINLAHRLFEQMPDANVVSWTSMIDGYARIDQSKQALSLFRKMFVEEGIKPTEITILAILPAIWNIKCVELCQSVHTYGEKSGFVEFDIRVANCLIDAYARCGCIDSALNIFEGLNCEKINLVSWTSIISGFAMHGMGDIAVKSFERMEEECLKPNRVTFLSILNACSHGGLVEEGLEFFRKMINECKIVPDAKHYGCLIDMLGRAGRLEEAENIALQIPVEIANVIIWRTLLGACSFHGHIEMGERIMRKIGEIETGYGGDYVLLSNMFASSGRFADVERVRRLMDERNASKVPGFSIF